MVKNLPATQETQVQSLAQEDPLEEGMATHSSILAWRVPWAEEPGRLQSMGSQRVRLDRATNTPTTIEDTDQDQPNRYTGGGLSGSKTQSSCALPLWNQPISLLMCSQPEGSLELWGPAFTGISVCRPG